MYRSLALRILSDNLLPFKWGNVSKLTIPFSNYLSILYQPRFVDVGVPPIWLGLALVLASVLSLLGARYAYWLEARLGTKPSLLLVTGLPNGAAD